MNVVEYLSGSITRALWMSRPVAVSAAHRNKTVFGGIIWLVTLPGDTPYIDQSYSDKVCCVVQCYWVTS